MAEKRRCPQCEDDGYIDLFDTDGFPSGARNCPDLDAPWHRPFNHTGILHLWVTIEGDCHLTGEPRPHPGIPVGVAKGNASAHLSLEAARRFRDQLDAAIAHTRARFERYAASRDSQAQGEDR